MGHTHESPSSRASVRLNTCVLLLLAGNAALLLYSNLGLSVQIVANADLTATLSRCTAAHRRLALAAADSTADRSLAASIEEAVSPRSAGGDRACSASNRSSYAAFDAERHIDMMSRCGRVVCGVRAVQSPACMSDCVARAAGLGARCARCFGELAWCSRERCLKRCVSDERSPLCARCNAAAGCHAEFEACSCMRVATLGAADDEDDLCGSRRPAGNDGFASRLHGTAGAAPLSSARQYDGNGDDDMHKDNEEFLPIGSDGDISFVYSVRRAWQGGARLLAVVVVACSGAWPYLKDLALAFAWFAPLMGARRRARLLQLLGALGRFSLVDVMAVAVILAGVRTTHTVTSTHPPHRHCTLARRTRSPHNHDHLHDSDPRSCRVLAHLPYTPSHTQTDFTLLDGALHVVTQSRPAIYAFAAAGLWALAQGEWMARHTRRGDHVLMEPRSVRKGAADVQEAAHELASCDDEADFDAPPMTARATAAAYERGGSTRWPAVLCGIGGDLTRLACALACAALTVAGVAAPMLSFTLDDRTGASPRVVSTEVRVRLAHTTSQAHTRAPRAARAP